MFGEKQSASQQGETDGGEDGHSSRGSCRDSPGIVAYQKFVNAKISLRNIFQVVRPPIRLARTADVRATGLAPRISGQLSIQSATPRKTRPSAVFTFIDSVPGRKVLNSAMCPIHPPKKATRPTQRPARAAREEARCQGSNGCSESFPSAPFTADRRNPLMIKQKMARPVSKLKDH